jgi:signal peptidase I
MVYAIPSDSMDPTLHGDDAFWQKDRVAINKLAYGPMIPFTKTRLFKTGSPKRFDIIVFVNPLNPEGPPLIKRVVGMPGEQVLINRHTLYIDFEELEVPDHLKGNINWLMMVTPPDWMVHRQILIYSKNVDYFAQIFEAFREQYELVDLAMKDYRRVGDQIEDLKLETMKPEEYTEVVERLEVNEEAYHLCRFILINQMITADGEKFGLGRGEELSRVPEGHYYVLGDNGSVSIDSRFMGWISEDLIIGRAFAIVTPFNRMTDLSGFIKTGSGKFWLLFCLGLLLAYEFFPYYIGHPYRLQYPNEEKGYTVRWVWLSHIGLGIRGPFRRGWWKFNANSLAEGTMVAVSDIHQRHFHFAGRVERSDAESQTVLIRRLDTGTIEQTDPKGVVGLLKPLWYPFGQTTLEVEKTNEQT